MILGGDAVFDVGFFEQRHETASAQRKDRLLQAVHLHRVAAHFPPLAGRSKTATVLGQISLPQRVGTHSVTNYQFMLIRLNHRFMFISFIHSNYRFISIQFIQIINLF